MLFMVTRINEIKLIVKTLEHDLKCICISIFLL